MSDPNENLPLGGQPPLSPLGGPSLEEEEKAMRKGKGRMLAGMILAVVAAVAALGLYLASGDDETYSEFGRNVNGLHQARFNKFWDCSFQGFPMAKVKNDQDLREQIHKRASVGKARFGRLVRDDCLPELAELEPGLTALIPPEEFAEQVRELSDSVGSLRSGWSDFIAHLDGLGDQPYDEGAASEQVGRIAKGWYDYRRTHGALNAKLREKLGTE